MQKTLFGILVAALLLTTANACHNHSEEDDTNAPVISISAPADNASISGAVSITGRVTDESLHELMIKVTKDADGSELFSSEPTVHDLTTYDIAESFTPAGLSGDTPVTLTVTAEDHGSNLTTKTVKFTVKP